MTVLDIDAAAVRGLDSKQFSELHEQFPLRWSPRSLAGLPLSVVQVETLLEAARWAPSCYNEQPWRFAWQVFFDLLVEGNQTWAVDAGALVAIAARRHFERNGKPNPVHAFDTGSAWMSLALPDGYVLCAMVAVGFPGTKDGLPDALRETETPSSRKPLRELAFHGGIEVLAAQCWVEPNTDVVPGRMQR